MDNRDHFEIYNDTDTDCPAGGVCKFSGGVTADGIASVVQPDADSMLNLVVTNFFLPAKSVGSGTLDNRVILTLDSAGGPATDGDAIGSQTGSFLPKKGKAGFVCVGGSNGLQASAVRGVKSPSLPTAAMVRLNANVAITVDDTDTLVLTLPLPSEGLYLITGVVTGDIRATFSPINVAFVLSRVFSGSGVLVDESVSYVVDANDATSGLHVVGSVPVSFLYTASAAENLTLKARRTKSDLAGSFLTCNVLAQGGGGVNGGTHLSYTQLFGPSAGVPGPAGPPGPADPALPNSWTDTQTFHPTTDVVPVVVQGGGAGTALLQQWLSAAGSVVASVSPTSGFTGSGAGLTGIPASGLTAQGRASLAAVSGSYVYLF